MKTSRRKFLHLLGASSLAGMGCATTGRDGVWVNDVHSRLNRTRVAEVMRADSPHSLEQAVRRAARDGQSIAAAGARHAMGGQQFATGRLLVDTRRMNNVLRFDPDRGTIEAEAGTQWPELLRFLLIRQRGRPSPWTIRQKQTGADRLSLGGAVAANIHGRGLAMKPFIGDIESFMLVDADGQSRVCGRTENADLFRLAVGGYGLFGLVSSVTLRLARRHKLRRVVEIIQVEELVAAVAARIRAGFTFGDFQFAIDPLSGDFLRQGVFSCYQPVADDAPMPDPRRKFSERDWRNLVYLAHADPGRAFREYAAYYLGTNGLVYWSDLHQFSAYPDGYHHDVDVRLGSPAPATEVITEIYVPRDRLVDFMGEAREDFRKHGVRVIYGTVRFIERDEESFLAWAREPYACVIFNLHTVHTSEGIRHSADSFRRLIDMAIRRAGSYYLTYHKFATREQVEACHPGFRDFLALKRKHDPQDRFVSDWYEHYGNEFQAG